MRKYAILLLLMLLCRNAGASDSIFGGSTGGNPSTSAVSYTSPMGTVGYSTTTTFKRCWSGSSGTLKNLYVEVTVDPENGGGTESWVFNVMVDDVASNLACTINEGSTTCNNVSDTISITAGEYFFLRATPSAAAPAATDVRTALTFDGDTAGESIQCGVIEDTSEGDNYHPTHGRLTVASDGGSLLEADAHYPMPTAGTFKNLYTQLQTAPSAGNTSFFTLRVNGADTALVATCIATETECTDTSNTVAVVKGDLVNLQQAWTNAELGGLKTMGLTFLADTDGESIVPHSSHDKVSHTGLEYNAHGSSTQRNWSATDTTGSFVSGATTFKLFRVKLSASPGSDGSYTFTLREDSGGGLSDTSIACTVTTNATTCEDVEDFTVTAGNHYNVKSAPGSTPLSNRLPDFSFLAFIDPGTAVTVIQGATLQGATIN